MKTREQVVTLTKRRSRKSKHVRRGLKTFKNNSPRLSVFRSSKHIYCQVIDDESGRTLAAASSLEQEIKGELRGLKKTEVASKIGSSIAEKAKAKGVSRVRFDRGYYKYHGRIKALAEAAREGGLVF